MNTITKKISELFKQVSKSENKDYKNVLLGASGYRAIDDGKHRTLVACQISTSGKSYKYICEYSLEEYHKKVEYDEQKKELYVVPRTPGSFIGKYGRNIKKLQEAYDLIGVRVIVVKE